MKHKITKAVIPAAGLGTRFLPVTKAIPKEMIPIIDKPMIHYIVEEAIQSGIQDIVMVSNPNKESLERYFGHSYELEDRLVKSGKEEWAKSIREIAESCNIIYVHQKEPLGLGHAVGVAQSVVGDAPFACLLADDLIDAKVPCIRQLMDLYYQHDKSVVGVMEVAESDVSKYGIVAGKPLDGSTGKTFLVDQMIEKPKPSEAPSRYAIPGRYVLAPEIFEHIRRTSPSKGGEIQLTDALLSLAKSQGLLAHCFEGVRYDTGDRIGYLDATLSFGLRRPELRDGLLAVIKKHLS